MLPRLKEQTVTRDEAIALFCYVRCALEFRVTLAEFMASELEKARGQLKRQASANHRQWLAGRVADLEGLIVQHASMRGEHPGVSMPPERDKTKPCEPRIKELAERLQETVERAAWESLRAAECNNASTGTGRPR